MTLSNGIIKMFRNNINIPLIWHSISKFRFQFKCNQTINPRWVNARCLAADEWIKRKMVNLSEIFMLSNKRFRLFSFLCFVWFYFFFALFVFVICSCEHLGSFPVLRGIRVAGLFIFSLCVFVFVLCAHCFQCLWLVPSVSLTFNYI